MLDRIESNPIKSNQGFWFLQQKTKPFHTEWSKCRLATVSFCFSTIRNSIRLQRNIYIVLDYNAMMQSNRVYVEKQNETIADLHCDHSVWNGFVNIWNRSLSHRIIFWTGLCGAALQCGILFLNNKTVSHRMITIQIDELNKTVSHRIIFWTGLCCALRSFSIQKPYR